MTDAALVRRSLGSLDVYLERLEDCRRFAEADFIADMFVYHTVERLLELAIQCCLDIGMHIVTDDKLREPESYADIFSSLQEGKVISADLALRLSKMAKFRNLLVHIYAKVEVEKVYSILHSGLGDIDEFSKAVLDYIG